MKLVHWPFMGGLLHLLLRGGDWAGPQPAQAPPSCTECTECNNPLINGQLLYNGLLLCGLLCPLKG